MPLNTNQPSGALANRKLNGINVLNAKGTILKKINVLFSVHFCSGKYSFSFNILMYLIYLKDGRQGKSLCKKMAELEIVCTKRLPPPI